MNAKLTAVIITKNEEDKIARCIESVNWADEIIIVDDESSDETVAIAEKLGAKVIASASRGNFDRQRNIGIDQASGDWIIQMDADEVVTEKLKDEITQAINNPQDFDAFKFWRRNFFLGRSMRYADQCHYWLRLFKKDKARYIGSDVHEKLKVEGKIGVIDACIDHFAFNSITQFIQRQNHYSSYEAKALFEREGAVEEKKIKYNIKIKPLKIFWKNYVKKKGYKDGMHGLIWCVLLAFRHVMIWAKYWEFIKNEKVVK